MITFAVLAFVLGALWLTAALVGFVFKLTFAVLGGVFGLLAGFAGLLLGALILVPLAALALLPVLLPALGVAALVWLVVRAARRPAAPAVTVTR